MYGEPSEPFSPIRLCPRLLQGLTVLRGRESIKIDSAHSLFCKMGLFPPDIARQPTNLLAPQAFN